MSPWSFSHLNHTNSLYRTVLYRLGPVGIPASGFLFSFTSKVKPPVGPSL